MLGRGSFVRGRGRGVATVLVALAALGVAVSAFAADEIPPAPTRWVTDGAGFLSDSARQSLDARLQSYQEKTGHQFLVWIGRSTGGVPIEDFAVRAFKAWAVGQRGKDDGIVLFLFAEDRTARFEVGYGLEGAFTDVGASRIIREVLAPRLQSGDRDGGLLAAVEATTAEIARGEGTPGVAASESPRSRPDAFGSGGRRGPREPLTTAEKIFLVILVVVVLFIVITNPGLALYLLQVIASGAGGSGGGGWSSGGGGGGFSGGGGRSGGGGASGSW